MKLQTEDLGDVVRAGVVEMASRFDEDPGPLRALDEPGRVRCVAAQAGDIPNENEADLAAVDETQQFLKARST